MINLRFEWDSKKNKVNLKKHNISFDEAKTVFLDDNAAITHDPEHSIESRYIIIGFTSSGRLILVCFCERDKGNTIRIISASGSCYCHVSGN